jgi:hypothetical protein
MPRSVDVSKLLPFSDWIAGGRRKELSIWGIVELSN